MIPLHLSHSGNTTMRTLAITLALTVTTLAADWPQWMGPTRDGVWTEAGVATTLPAGGPKKLWSAKVHGGYSGPAVANGVAFVMDYDRKEGNAAPDPARQNDLKGRERVLAFDAVTGKELWKRDYDCPYHVSYPAGPRCTPTVHEGKVYALGTMGHLHCLNAKDGEVLWKHDFVEEFKAKLPIWGFAGHPLVYKNTLICLVGGPEALLMAFDKDTGAMKWKALATPTTDGPGYCPPSLVQAGGVTQLVVWHPQAIVSVNPDSGAEYWRESLKPNYGMSIMMPRAEKGLLYAGGIGGAAVALKLHADAPKAEKVWAGEKKTGVYPANSTPIVHDGTIYGVDVSGELRAVSLADGTRYWNATEATVNEPQTPLPHGTAFLVRNSVNNHYYIFNEKGSLIIAKLSPQKYEAVAEAKLVKPTTPAFNRTVVWSHPAFANQCVFVRNDEELACFSLKP
jgi:outer membrane protein assembly factor BamB